MSQLGSTVTVRGEVSSTDDLSIEGRVDGPVWCEGHAVTIAETAMVNGDVFARDITVAGTVNGTLLAREIVDVRASAQVTGRIVSARLILAEGGCSTATCSPIRWTPRSPSPVTAARKPRTVRPAADADRAAAQARSSFT